MIYGWQVCDTGKAEKQNVFLLTPLTDTETPHAPRNTAKMVLGDQVYTLTLAGEGYDSLLIGQKKVYALCQGTLTTYRIRDRKRADISLAFSAERASFAADGKTLLLASEGKLYAYLVR